MRDAGMCIVLSSHILEEIRILCDQVAIVAGRRVVAQGSPEDLCRETDTASLEDAFVQLTGRQETLECSAKP
jgi:sodium transport system ATP-binding protein